MDSNHPVLETEGLTIQFGGHVAVDHVSCAFHAGTLTSIVGPNGAGKTTYFNLISGQLPPTEGGIKLFGRDITHLPAPARTHLGIGRAFQLTNLFPALSVVENVRLAVASRQGVGYAMLKRADRQLDLHERAMHYLEKVGLAARARWPAAALPHGDQRKLEVGILLALEPDIFMFDEPTAGMSVDEVPVVLELINRIKEDQDKTVLLVEHKMDVVRSLSDRIVVLHNGQLVADGEPAEVMASPVVQEAYLGVTPGNGEEQPTTSP